MEQNICSDNITSCKHTIYQSYTHKTIPYDSNSLILLLWISSLSSKENPFRTLYLKVFNITIIDLSERVLGSLVISETLALGSSEGGDSQNNKQSNNSLEVHFYLRCFVKVLFEFLFIK